MRQLAFYYPATMWRDGNWARNLILFFDGVALLVPDYMKDRPLEVDPNVAGELVEEGLLSILTPETFVDESAARQLVDAMLGVVQSGALDSLSSNHRMPFADLSMSRMGYTAGVDVGGMLHAELERRGLARHSENGLTVPVHPIVRHLVLTLLSQILRVQGERQGLALHPSTDQVEILENLRSLLSLNPLPSASHVVTMDLESVGIDLTGIPIREVLDFKDDFGEEYEHYALNLRKFIRDASRLDERERQEATDDRRKELALVANGLRDRAQTRWKLPASLGLGIAGAAWEAKQGDLFSAALSLGAGVLGYQPVPSVDAGAYSYLFQAKRKIV